MWCPYHNLVDDECCPDFSCCVPSLFESKRREEVEIIRPRLHPISYWSVGAYTRAPASDYSL